jgi:hypothetical protein
VPLSSLRYLYKKDNMKTTLLVMTFMINIRIVFVVMIVILKIVIATITIIILTQW